jgi:glucose/arabinose dehydrogenase
VGRIGTGDIGHRAAGREALLLAALIAAALIAAAVSGCEPSTRSPVPTARPGTSAPGSSTGSFDASGVAIAVEPFATIAGAPLAMAAPKDGTGRLFVAAQDGQVWVVSRDGATSQAPTLDIRPLVTSGGERGLLGLALHPDFPDDPRAFVDYTDRNGNTVVASYTVDPSNPDRLDPGSAVDILHVGQPYANHNGGGLAFGPNGYLYVTLGDGGGGGDPQGNAQRLDTTLGKILRIDVDASSGGRRYGIPAGNPFVGDPFAHPEIWLYGLRNPWRLSFDRQTRDLWIGDVGQGAREEIDVARAGVAGVNFGWNRMEGSSCYGGSRDCDQSGLTLPVAEYGHDLGCTVIGGYVYRGAAYPILQGGYLFADYCKGTIWALDSAVTQLTPAIVVGQTDGSVSSFGEDADGELYLMNLHGTIGRVVASPR